MGRKRDIPTALPEGGPCPEILCCNCDQPINERIRPFLFCSVACKQEAKLVRYCRRAWKEDRFSDPAVGEVFQIRLAFIVSGGYPERERRISSSMRSMVFARDDGKC